MLSATKNSANATANPRAREGAEEREAIFIGRASLHVISILARSASGGRARLYSRAERGDKASPVMPSAPAAQGMTASVRISAALRRVAAWRTGVFCRKVNG